MTAERMVITKDEDMFVVRSVDAEIKQEFFGWGSYIGAGHDDHPEFYGRDVDPRSPPPGTTLYGKAAEDWLLRSPSDLCWEWRLSRASIEYLLRRMELRMMDPKLLEEDEPGEIEAREHIMNVLGKVIQ